MKQEIEQGRVRAVRNRNGIKVRKSCCSCHHKMWDNQGIKRMCALSMEKVEKFGYCDKWMMSEATAAVGDDGKAPWCHTLKTINTGFIRAQKYYIDQLVRRQLGQKTENQETEFPIYNMELYCMKTGQPQTAEIYEPEILKDYGDSSESITGTNW